MPDHASPLKPQFDDLNQQHASDVLGMWIFLATEILLFGGLFLGYTAYRLSYPAAFAIGSAQMEMGLGTLNTAVLLTSSLTMALAVHASRRENAKTCARLLLLTALLGLVFIGIKGTEYVHHYQDGLAPSLNFTFAGPHAAQVALFFVFYFVMTGLHAVHLLIGIGIVLVLAAFAHKGRLQGMHAMPIVLGGLFWHLIDVVWVFLYPTFYLIAPAAH
ncbi:Quinol oxidase subunit 3 [compost metagenome]